MISTTKTAKKQTVVTIDPRVMKKLYEHADEKQKVLSQNFPSTTLLGDVNFLGHFLLWVTFWRRNLHRFATDYLGLSLKLYQVIMLYLMGINNTFVCIASRASAKSFVIAIYACCKAILYPQSSIVLCSGTKNQAKLLVSEKIEKELCSWSPVLKREIKKIITNNNNVEVIFYNGSKINVVVASDAARGYRATDIVREECRQIPKWIDDSVLSPFKFIRPTPYLSTPFYSKVAELQEDATDIYISSSYFDNGGEDTWMWEIVDMAFDDMLNGKPSCLLAFDETVALYFGIKKREDLLKEKKKQDRLTWLLEFKNCRLKDNQSAYFSYKLLSQNQVNKHPFYPRTLIDFRMGKKNPYDIPKQKNEVRIISCDIAFVTNKNNDNSIFTCMRGLPEATTIHRENQESITIDNGYRRVVSYIDSMQGGDVTKQALRIRQLYEDFGADFIVLDTRNGGITILSLLSKVMYDEERGKEYSPLACMNNDEYKAMTYVEGAKECIYAVNATQKLNSDIAQNFKGTLQAQRIDLPVTFEKAKEDILPNIKEYLEAEDGETQAFYESPYLETQALISETTSLLYERKEQTGVIVVHEQGKNRKDRYTSVSYGDMFFTQLEKDLMNNIQEYEVGVFVN